jgi:hypothetical protein
VSSTAAVEAIERIVNRGGDPDDVLRDVVATVVDRGGAMWAGILFDEDGELMLGPHAGVAEPGARRQTPVVCDGSPIGELAVDGLDDQPLIERIALLISPYCRAGWSTGAAPWEEPS